MRGAIGPCGHPLATWSPPFAPPLDFIGFRATGRHGGIFVWSTKCSRRSRPSSGDLASAPSFPNDHKPWEIQRLEMNVFHNSSLSIVFYSEAFQYLGDHTKIPPWRPIARNTIKCTLFHRNSTEIYIRRHQNTYNSNVARS